MSEKKCESNQVAMTGEIFSPFEYSHEVKGTCFYSVKVAVTRISGFSDFIPLIVSEKLVDVTKDYSGKFITVKGQLRSHNIHIEKKNHVKLFVFALKLEFISEIPQRNSNNQIFLDGYLCKKPIYRKTPLGRKITDLFIAVNRAYGKTDYIPCICWGRRAYQISKVEIGTHVQVLGRIQSRLYIKKRDENISEQRMAYELSACKIYIDNQEIGNLQENEELETGTS